MSPGHSNEPASTADTKNEDSSSSPSNRRRLPLELVHRIIHLLKNDKPNLSSLARVSKQFHQIVIPHLWKHFDIDPQMRYAIFNGKYAAAATGPLPYAFSEDNNNKHDCNGLSSQQSLNQIHYLSISYHPYSWCTDTSGSVSKCDPELFLDQEPGSSLPLKPVSLPNVEVLEFHSLRYGQLHHELLWPGQQSRVHGECRLLQAVKPRHIVVRRLLHESFFFNDINIPQSIWHHTQTLTIINSPSSLFDCDILKPFFGSQLDLSGLDSIVCIRPPFEPFNFAMLDVLSLCQFLDTHGSIHITIVDTFGPIPRWGRQDQLVVEPEDVQAELRKWLRRIMEDMSWKRDKIEARLINVEFVRLDKWMEQRSRWSDTFQEEELESWKGALDNKKEEGESG
ncbi:uncharacterized protein I303_102018 [Kwoniella dejecticola CBS 10117]|uniref:F-box domain-containing protein n=1 Tax=Kwoniella dejecticola CBS 10117 TaxID=1296121 RepID=A0A1A6AC39_9TREE|nr:uncharacterized protein I303_01844 [Kwoniella dejecticola CBS 10117]OBR87636.1 hypothetical protein I303_01844 [Kwoniella dejecticola CBS 10117]